MITKAQIDEWLQLNANGGDNNKACPTCGHNNYFIGSSLKHKLLEAKVLVDRWDNYASEIIIHSSKKGFFIEELGDLIVKQSIVRGLESISEVLNKKFFDAQKIKDLLDNVEVKPEEDSIWGATIHYSDDCPVDKGLFVDTSSRAKTTNARHIAVFPM